MADTLLETARHYVEAHADANGIATTPVPGLRIVRRTCRGACPHPLDRPAICLVLQGALQLTRASRILEAGAGQSLLLASGVPAVQHVRKASALEPYVALVVDLDVALVANLALDMASGARASHASSNEDTDDAVAGVALQLMRLVGRPGSIPLLLPHLLRELHYWLLEGRHGPAIRAIAGPDNAARRVSRAVAAIRADFSRTLPVDRLASIAGMSLSAFHQHFRAATSMTPLQFQKQLRLLEARRLMLADGISASSAAFRVGYQSVSQFNRDYRRAYGLPPVRETSSARRGAIQQPQHASPAAAAASCG